MTTPSDEVILRPVSELDFEGVSAIDEKIGGAYRPAEWEERIAYYISRDPELSLVAVSGKRVVGFMLGEIRSFEFGLTEPTGWIEILGVDPEAQGQAIGRRLCEGLLERFRARGARSVRTLVDSEQQKELLGFFESMRFEATPARALALRL